MKNTSSPSASLAVLVLLAGLLLTQLPFVTLAANRLLSGTGQSLRTVLASQPLWWPLPLALLLSLASTLHRRLRTAALWASAAAIATLFWGLLYWAGSFAHQASIQSDSLARTSPGSGFWLGALVLWLAASDALRQLRPPRWASAAYWLVLAAGVFAWLASGWLDDLSAMKEYAGRSEQFWGAIGQHLRIVGLTVALTLASGIPLGIWLHRHAACRGKAFLVLNFVQTIPSIAMFGLLMALLAVAARLSPWLQTVGISGVGLTPAVPALTFYSLLPLVRSLVAGLQQVPAGVRESAQAMGLSPRQLLWQVELPLALPVLLAGIKVLLIQAIGLAAVAALIGAGGLGSLMFEGLFSSAIDLVVLAVVPLVTLSVLADALFGIVANDSI